MSMSLTPVLEWAADQVGPGARVVAVEGLRPGAGPWRLRIARGGTQSEAVLRVGEPHHREQVATEAAAPAFAAEHQLAAPRLLAVDLAGSATGRPVLLTTVLAGTSRISATASPGRLRALGAGGSERVRPRRPVAGQHAVARRGVGGHGRLGRGRRGAPRYRPGDAAVGCGDPVWAAGRGEGPGGLAAAGRPAGRGRRVLGRGGGVDHPRRRRGLVRAMAGGGRRAWPRRSGRRDPRGSPRRIPAGGARPARPPIVTATARPELTTALNALEEAGSNDT